ncbi:MAG: DUF1295 domain-containing protein [Clostridia bacterium]|nr:DUF1295 domain-containing protein [Clostridia bacterium]
MGWEFLWIILLVCAVLCAVGFYKFVYFLSIGYGFAVAGGGITILIMTIVNAINGTWSGALIWLAVLQAILFVAYGVRLSGFLLIRELKDAAFKKTNVYKETLDKSEKPMPIFVLATIWVFVSILYTMQVSPMLFMQMNGINDLIAPIIGMVISVGGLVLESIADKQKSEQKKENPNMVATKGLYKIVRCPNYLGEITFWTGIFVSGVTTFNHWGQWAVAIFAYVAIVFIMFNGAQRLEKRQMKRYGDDPVYNEYANKTPIILPLVPLYHLNKKD